ITRWSVRQSLPPPQFFAGQGIAEQVLSFHSTGFEGSALLLAVYSQPEPIAASFVSVRATYFCCSTSNSLMWPVSSSNKGRWNSVPLSTTATNEKSHPVPQKLSEAKFQVLSRT